MSALNWDVEGDRLFETGVDQVVLYPMNDDGTYEDGVAWNGVTGITESPEGAEANDIYADNIKYLSLISKEDWKGTIKAYTYPEEFNACMGNYKKSGIKAYFGQQKRKKFALSWRTRLGNDVNGDAFAYKIHIAWGLSAAPSEMDHATVNDSPEAQEFSWEISSIPPQTTEKIFINGGTAAANQMSLQACAHVFIASKINLPGSGDIDNETTIKAVEAKLYGKDPTTVGGDDGTDPEVPTLTDLIKFFKNDGIWPSA